MNKSSDTTRNGQTAISRLAKTSLQTVKLLKKSSKLSIFASLIGVSPHLAMIISIIVIVVLVASLLLSLIPTSLLFSTPDSNKQTRELVESIVYDNFTEILHGDGPEVKKAIISQINAIYGTAGDIHDVYESDQYAFIYCTPTCQITIDYTPSYSEMNRCMCAYISAMDSVIESYSEKEKERVDKWLYEGSILLYDEKGNVSLNKDILAQFGLYNQNAYFLELYLQSMDAFVLDYLNSDRWKFEVDEVENLVLDVLGSTTGELRALDGYYGTITLNMFYDLHLYRLGEYQSALAYQKLQGLKNPEKSMAEALESYYENYLNTIGTIPDIYRDLLDDYYLLYAPCSGIENFCLFMPDIDQSGSVELFINGSSDNIWSEIETLRNNGTVSTYGDFRQCTCFANYWFYLLYGEGYVLKGNGSQMVDSLLESEYGKSHFVLSRTPTPGSIFSMSHLYNKAGHVGCVDAVDYNAGTITFSDGNIGENNSIMICRTMTFDEFDSYVRGSSIGSQIQFANPVLESFDFENGTTWFEQHYVKY